MTDAILQDAPPASDHITDYERRHLVIYLRLLDAAAENADWREVAKIVLGLDPSADPDGCRRIHAAHLERARWMTHTGYKDLLTGRDIH